MVDAQLLPRAVLHFVRKQPQLADRSPALSVEARFGQAAFLHCALGQRVAQRVDLVCDKAQEGGAFAQRQRAEHLLRFGRSLAGIGYVAIGGGEERLTESFAGGCILGAEGFARLAAFACDHVFARHRHSGSPVVLWWLTILRDGVERCLALARDSIVGSANIKSR